MSSRKDIAVVILNYNGQHHLAQYLPSVLQYCPDNAYVVVADNGSTDDSVSYLKEHFATEIDLIAMSENYGFAGGYNEALKQVDAKYYILLNSDVEIRSEWITPMYLFLEEHDDVAACQPKVRSLREEGHFEYAGAAGGFLDSMAYPYCRGRLLMTIEKDEGQYDENRPIFWATGAAMMIRSEIYHKLMGLDADFFAHMEEIDLCWRIQRAGGILYCIPSATVYHLGGGTLSYHSPRKTLLNFRNSLYMILKNERGFNLIWILPLRMILDGVAGLRFVLLGEWQNMWAIVKAHFQFYGNFIKTYRKRKQFLHLLRSQNIIENAVFHGKTDNLLIVDYFLRGKRTFADMLNKKTHANTTSKAHRS